MTVREAARKMDYSDGYVRMLLKAGTVKAKQSASGAWDVDIDDLERHAEAMRHKMATIPRNANGSIKRVTE